MRIDNEPMTTNFEFMDYAAKLRLPLIGVFNKDTLPKKAKNGCYLINMQDDMDEFGNDLFGSHWVSCYIENGKACYFDSFGFIAPLQVRHFLAPFNPVPYNKKQIQNITSYVCGYYCLYFFFYMHNKQNKQFLDRFNDFLDLWSNDVKENKSLLIKYLKPL